MKCLILFITLFLFFSCTQKETLFELVEDSKTQIKFQNKLKPTKDLNILNYLYYYNGAGVAAADFNNDGLADLYFVNNQSKDKLYLNLGNFSFKETTQQSQIKNNTPWTTGITTVDINNDGLLDIYLCKIGNHNKIKGKNLLYVNQGINEKGIPSFKENASKYGLDISSYATQSIFFDYDQDGDLDMFLLNHSVHPNSNYGKGKLREQIDLISGDKLFENIKGKFIDVSTRARIFQGKIGYGLGVSVGDVNNDGYPDIYVGNDFFENDYLYINQKNKTFKEVISTDKTALGHTSHFSMGNSITDFDNDQNLDILSLDMLPENLKTYKTSGLEYPYQSYEYYLKNGYSPQFMQNTLHYNNGNNTFSETAYLSGLAATEWSWSPIVGDFNNDGLKDIYITNGILGATNDMDYINFISNQDIQKQLATEKSNRNLELSKKIPQKKVTNYFYKNNGDRTFSNVTNKWTSQKASFSNGGVYVDLDNDGDLDVVINNINENAFILKNNSEVFEKNNYLILNLKGGKNNLFGIGTKVKAYVNNYVLTEENYTTKGYLSSVEPKIHLGLGKAETIDSIKIIWPNHKSQTLKNIKANQEIEVSIVNAKNNRYYLAKEEFSYLINKDSILEFKHKDKQSLEFNREPLIPFASTNLGSNTTVKDINNDSLEDVFICGAKGQSSKLYTQNSQGGFNIVQDSLFKEYAINEDVSAVFFDANKNGFEDLLVVSGGNEFKQGKPLQPRLYINKGGRFFEDKTQFKNIELNASKVTIVDIDNDGDKDICITSNLIPREFGRTPKQYIFKNDGNGNFKDVTLKLSKDFQQIGNVQDIMWSDINQDNFLDAIVVGHWMPISIFLNDGEKLTLQKNNNLEKTNGWWNTIQAKDFDNDGDVDFIAGNWGLNTRLTASIKEPITLYNNDFDDNNTIDPIVSYFYQGLETPFASKDELVKQLPFLNKKYLSYKAYAEADFDELFSKEKIKESDKKYVYELASCYFENLGNNTFKKHQLPFMGQISSVNAIALEDFNKDDFIDVFLVGNNYHINTQLSKLDASHGMIMMNNKKGFFKVASSQEFNVSGDARSIKKIKINQDLYYIVSINNRKPTFLKINK